jgi:phosphoglycolate phosphatase
VKYRLLLFDFDFTLVDASECLFGALRKGLASIGAEDPLDSQLRPLIGIPLLKQYQVLTGRQDAKEFATFERIYAKERSALERNGTNLLPSVRWALEGLRAAGYQLGVVSTGASGRIQRTLTRFQLMPYFTETAIMGGAQNKLEAISKAIRRFRTKPWETVYIGDRPDDADAAKNAGVNFIGVTTGAFRESDFPSGSRVVHSLADLIDFL